MRLITHSKYFSDISDQWLSKEFPDWLSSARSLKQESSHENPNSVFCINACPGFIDIFKNSLVLRAPCDMLFRIHSEGPDRGIFATAANTDFVCITFHNLEEEIDPEWGRQHVNFKIGFEFMMISDSEAGGEKCLILPPDYHVNEKRPDILKPMIGTLPALPDTGVNFQLNMIANAEQIMSQKEIFISKGDILAYLYFPSRIKNGIELVTRSEYDARKFMRTSFSGDYLRQLRGM
jgi:hypothetical protein